ncbi:glycosyltransferase family 4 protein [Sphingomonas arenae]|uniref:glycosyltransferase family 4 protein n=1 Tax=Sphingomonas arenae TaxID=2812555 RepID=UPI001967D2C3|nr:glycosyltransferase family 4 protein [Sphingomonas arenae]
MTGRLKLLLTTDAVGGVWTYSLDLAQALADADDVMVYLAVLGPSPTPEQLDAAAATPGLQLIDTGLPLDWLADDPAHLRDAAKVLNELAVGAGVDLVQLHTPALAAIPFDVPLVGVVHSCVGSWWSAVKDGPLPSDIGWRAELVSEGLRRLDAVLAPTHAFAAAVRETYGLPSLPVAVHNGRAAAGLPPIARADVAFTAGRLWDEGKDIATFDRAAALSSVPFKAAGLLKGPNGARVVLSHAQALGRLDGAALKEQLAAQPIFVSTARYEPFGLSVLEAAQAGCALVLTDIPTFRELWNEAALFVPLHDEHAVAAAVDQLIADPAARARLSEAARTRAEQFTPAATASAMLEQYRTLLSVDRKVAA